MDQTATNTSAPSYSTADHVTEITEVRIRLHEPKGDGEILRAFANITINACFAVHNLRIIEHGTRGLFVSMPAVRRAGKYEDTAHPVNRDFRRYLESRVIEEYHHELAKRG